MSASRNPSLPHSRHFLLIILFLMLFHQTQAQDTVNRIAFTSDRDGSPKVYTMLPDGSDVQLVGNGVLDAGGTIKSLTVSPDGSKAAFVSQKVRDGIDSFGELFILDFATGGVTQITNDDIDKISPLWLSDNTNIVYLSGGLSPDYTKISQINIVTRALQVIATGDTIAQRVESDFAVGIRQISISPDEQQLIVGVQKPLALAYNILVLMNIDGSHIHQITPDTAVSAVPRWSSDADIIYYVCEFEGYDEICRLDLQSSESQIVTDIRNSLPSERRHYINTMDVSPENQIVFQLAASRNIYLFNPDDGSITILTESETSDNHLLGWVNLPPVTFARDTAKTPYISWSPDGTLLAAGNHTDVQIVDPTTMKVLNTLTDVGGQTTEAAWNSDSSRLAMKSRDGIEIWQTPGDPTSAHRVLNISAYKGIIPGISWSPDDSQLANAAGDFIFLWDAKTGESIRSISGDWGNTEDLVWTTDNRLAVGSIDSTVRIVDSTGESLTNYYASRLIPVPAVTAIALSPDGDQMAIGVEDDPVLIWGNTRTGNKNAAGELWEDTPQMYLYSKSVNENFQGTDYPLSLSWNSTGDYIASGSTDGTVRIWDARTGDELQTILVGINTAVNSVAWSPDGTQLAYGKPDGTVEIIPAPASDTTTPIPNTPSPP